MARLFRGSDSTSTTLNQHACTPFVHSPEGSTGTQHFYVVGANKVPMIEVLGSPKDLERM